MDELAPGLYHWTAWRKTIRRTVHSAYVEPARALIDPMLPEEGVGWFAEHGPPERIVLSNRHHLRHSERFVERYGCTVQCDEAGLWDLTDRSVKVQGFRFGDEVAPGVVAHEVGVLCPEESALHIAVGPGALACADGVIRGDDGALAFVSDVLLGDDPQTVRRGLAAAYGRLADELEFDILLLAHGAPFPTGGREALRAFAQARADG